MITQYMTIVQCGEKEIWVQHTRLQNTYHLKYEKANYKNYNLHYDKSTYLHHSIEYNGFVYSHQNNYDVWTDLRLLILSYFLS